MSGFVRVENVESLQVFRQCMLKFAESVNTALADAEAEAARVLVWLETEAQTYWGSQIRKRHEICERCKDAVRQKKLYKSPTGNTQSAVEEEKALRVAKAKLEEAEVKLKNVRRYGPRLQKELAIYKGGVSRLQTDVSADVPLAIARLDKMIASLRAYANLTISGAGAIAESSEAAASMARAAAAMAATKEDFAPLRKKTLLVDRTKATPADIRLEAWSDGLVTDREREMMAKIQAARRPLLPEARVIIEKGAWESDRIYLERTAPAEGDSGWFLGNTEGKAKEYVVVTVGALAEARSDLAEVLVLPAGWLAIIGSTGVEVVLDERGADLWGREGVGGVASTKVVEGTSAPAGIAGASTGPAGVSAGPQ